MEAHHLIETPQWPVDLGRADEELVRGMTARIRERIGQAAEAIYEIGCELRKVKTILGRRGKWEQWLSEEFAWTDRTARRYMAVALKLQKPYEADNLSLYAPSALYILAAESTSEAARDEADKLSASGQRITYTGAQEMTERHKAAQEAVEGLPEEQQQELLEKAKRSKEQKTARAGKQSAKKERLAAVQSLLTYLQQAKAVGDTLEGRRARAVVRHIDAALKLGKKMAG